MIGGDVFADIFKVEPAAFLGVGFELWAEQVDDVGRRQDHARVGGGLEPCGDVDPVAEYVAVVSVDHVTHMDADADFGAYGIGGEVVSGGDFLAKIYGCLHTGIGAGELGEKAVGGAVKDSAAMLLGMLPNNLIK